MKSKKEVEEEMKREFDLWLARLELDSDFTVGDWVRAVTKADNMRRKRLEASTGAKND